MEPRKQRAEAIEIGGRLRRAREAHGLSKTALAAAVGVNRSLLTYLESGKRAPSVFLAMHLIDVLEISPQYLLWGSLQGVDGALAAKLVHQHPTLDVHTVPPRASTLAHGRIPARRAEPPHRRKAS